jgi:hypothetical protein
MMRIEAKIGNDSGSTLKENLYRLLMVVIALIASMLIVACLG